MDHTQRALKEADISSVIQKGSLFGGSIHQSAPFKNIAFRFERMDVDTSGKLKIKLPHGEKVNPEKPLGIHLNYRSTSFHLSPSQYKVLGDLIEGQLPSSAKAIELRSTDRYAFPLLSNVNADLYRIEKRASSPEIKSSLIDVSFRGIGISISGIEEDSLKANDHLWVKSLDGLQLEKPIFARVVYLLRKQFKDAVEIKAGISLDEALPEEIFDVLRKKSSLVLKA